MRFIEATGGEDVFLITLERLLDLVFSDIPFCTSIDREGTARYMMIDESVTISIDAKLQISSATRHCYKDSEIDIG